MKQIRKNTFETNSSSVHTLTVCTTKEFSNWEDNDNTFFDILNEELVTKEEAEERLKRMNEDYHYISTKTKTTPKFEDYFYTYDEYIEDIGDKGLVFYKERTKTPSGEKIIAFGKFGVD